MIKVKAKPASLQEKYRRRFAGSFERYQRAKQLFPAGVTQHAGQGPEALRERAPTTRLALHPRRRPDINQLARYIVTVIEGAIMQSRTLAYAKLLGRQFALLKEHLKRAFDG